MEILNNSAQLMQKMGLPFDSSTFSIVLLGALVYVAALWIALIVWTTRDVINRSNSLIFQVFIISLNIFFPLFGLIIYLIIRPTETLLQKYCQDLEYRTYIDSMDRCLCDFCNASIDKDYLFCPECDKQVKKKCSKCHKPFMTEWDLCPYCGVKSGHKTARKKAETPVKK